MRKLRWLDLYLALGAAYAGFVVYESLAARPFPAPPWPNADKLGHLAAYGLMMAWFGQLALERRVRALLALGFMALGGLLELAPLWLGSGPGRDGAWSFVAADCLGVWLGHLATQTGGGGLLVALERALLGRR